VFPYPAYVRGKGFVELAAQALPMFLVIGFVFIVPSVVVNVVSEKETGIKVFNNKLQLSSHVHINNGGRLDTGTDENNGAIQLDKLDRMDA